MHSAAAAVGAAACLQLLLLHVLEAAVRDLAGGDHSDRFFRWAGTRARERGGRAAGDLAREHSGQSVDSVRVQVLPLRGQHAERLAADDAVSQPGDRAADRAFVPYVSVDGIHVRRVPPQDRAGAALGDVCHVHRVFSAARGRTDRAGGRNVAAAASLQKLSNTNGRRTGSS